MHCPITSANGSSSDFDSFLVLLVLTSGAAALSDHPGRAPGFVSRRTEAVDVLASSIFCCPLPTTIFAGPGLYRKDYRGTCLKYRVLFVAGDRHR